MNLGIRLGDIKPNAGTVAAAIVTIVEEAGQLRRSALLGSMAMTKFTHPKAQPSDKGWCQGYVAGAIYDTLVLGTTITKAIDGDSKSYSFRFIDWENPTNNSFHVTAEFSVERTGRTQIKRCDIVAFVNGIPVLVIENKRPTESLKKAGSQLVGYQNEDKIPQLFHFAQLLLTMNRIDARYATVGTPQKFWSTWRDEEDTDEAIRVFANRLLTDPEKDAVFSGDFAGARRYFDAMAEGPRAVSAQDRTLFALCRPERVDAIDYVITHELCHITEPHHGAAFYVLLAQVMPDWERRKLRLERSMA